MGVPAIDGQLPSGRLRVEDPAEAPGNTGEQAGRSEELVAIDQE